MKIVPPEEEREATAALIVLFIDDRNESPCRKEEISTCIHQPESRTGGRLWLLREAKCDQPREQLEEHTETRTGGREGDTFLVILKGITGVLYVF
jgi:hypothetical protein